MALKNTYAKLPAQRYISDIQEALVGAGAVGISYGYEGARIVSLMFALDLNGHRLNFQLPVGWRKVQQVLKNEAIGRANDDEYAYRVSWAIMRDWIEAQLAILASETVTMPQLFLPYAIVKGGQTLFEKVVESPNFLLGDGK